MSSTNLVRASTSNTKRYFYALEDKVWRRIDFMAYRAGDRLMFIENGKRSNVFTVRNAPTFHPAYGPVVEALPNYRMQETVMLGEVREKIRHADGVSPVYITVGEKVLTVSGLFIGDKGEVMIQTREEKNSSFELSDDVPLAEAMENNLAAVG